MLIPGRFDSTGSPIITIQVAGATGSKTYQAIIDTGFTGFVALPWGEMIELGLKTQGAADITLGDGSVVANHVSIGTVTLGTQAQSGLIILDENSADVLIGMGFLREFKKSLILTDSAVVLYDEHETLEAIVGLMRDLPQGQPDINPARG
jgi:predicted aspartyl protease